MKKILILVSALAVPVLALVSCNKQSDIKVVDSQTNNNNGSGGGSNSFNWTGTEPMSAKVDGTAWQASSVKVILFAGYWNISGKSADNSSINLSVPENSAPGQVFSAPSPSNIGWQTPTTLLMANPGKMKVITNNGTTIEGYFWAETKDPTGSNPKVTHITEGYFKVEKP